MTLPLARMPYVRQQFLDANGLVLSNGYLKFFETGTSTPIAVYADAGPNPVSLGVTVTLDASGVAPSIFVPTEGMDVEVYDENDVLQTRLSGDQVEDVGSAFLSFIGQSFATGSTGVVSGYQVLAGDNYVETAAVATNPFIITLDDMANRGQPLCIKHKGTGSLRVTPTGTQTLEGIAAYYVVPAASSPNFPTVWLFPLPSGAGSIIGASHGL